MDLAREKAVGIGGQVTEKLLHNKVYALTRDCA